MIRPIFNDGGNSPDKMQLLYSLFRYGAMVSFTCLITITGISLDLPFLKSLIISTISSEVVSVKKIESV